MNKHEISKMLNDFLQLLPDRDISDKVRFTTGSDLETLSGNRYSLPLWSLKQTPPSDPL